MVQSFSLIGAAITISIGYTIYGLAYCYFFIIDTKIQLKYLIPTRLDVKPILLFLKNNIKFPLFKTFIV